jgi:hypothetical protein
MPVEGLDVLPGQTIDYSVDLDKESNNLLATSGKRNQTGGEE